MARCVDCGFVLVATRYETCSACRERALVAIAALKAGRDLARVDHRHEGFHGGEFRGRLADVRTTGAPREATSRRGRRSVRRGPGGED